MAAEVVAVSWPCDLMLDDLTPKWCDPVAVDRALAGQPVGRPLHHAERVEVARRALAADFGVDRIATLVGCNRRDVTKIIKEATPVDADAPIDLWPVDDLELDVDSPIDLWPTETTEANR